MLCGFYREFEHQRSAAIHGKSVAGRAFGARIPHGIPPVNTLLSPLCLNNINIWGFEANQGLAPPNRQ